MCQEEFGYDQMVSFNLHVSDDFATAETEARSNWYNVSGIPDVRIDGKYSEVGASNCDEAAGRYRNRINQRLNETGGISPVEIDGSYLPLGNQVPVEATFRLVDPATLNNLRATLILYENNILYNGELWNLVTREIYDEYVTLSNVGDEVTLSTVINVPYNWDVNELHAIAYLQVTTGNKEIIQGAMLPIGDFSFELATTVGSVPDGNGQAVFDAVLTNISDEIDTYTLEPGNLFGDWITDFKVCGDPTWHTDPTQVILNPGESCDVQIRVTTDGTTEIRSGDFEVTSTWSTRTVTSEMDVFNGSYSIFFVDDDSHWDHEVAIRDALDADGYLYTYWDVYNDHAGATPAGAVLMGYDYVIWQTGASFSSSALGAGAQNALMNYMDSGGRVFVSSQILLNNLEVPNTFVTDYLGVADWTLDTAYDHFDGVAGDPIGDGLSMDMTYDIPTFKRGDDAVPGPTATTWITAPDGSHAGIRNEFGDSGRSVFMPCAIHTIDDNADPNNLRVLLQRVLGWLEPEVPADAGEPVAMVLGSRIEHARPNPFNPRTEIAFQLSPEGASERVSLEVFDLAGRKVARVFQGSLGPGPHARTWTGRSDAGAPVESGVYFVRLTTREGTSSKKLILLK